MMDRRRRRRIINDVNGGWKTWKDEEGKIRKEVGGRKFAAARRDRKIRRAMGSSVGGTRRGRKKRRDG